jgi:putative SOS response-associated peptidase YedK
MAGPFGHPCPRPATAAPEDAFKLLRQYPDTHMVATPVSKRVNTPKNNDAELIVPAMVA